MKTIPLPKNFDGIAFHNKFGLADGDAYVAYENLYYDEEKVGKILEPIDLIDCIVDVERLQRIRERESTAKASAKNIPGYASWSGQEALEWANGHISDTQIDAIDNLAEAKAVLKDMSKAIQCIGSMAIAIRNEMWPDLPED